MKTGRPIRNAGRNETRKKIKINMPGNPAYRKRNGFTFLISALPAFFINLLIS